VYCGNRYRIANENLDDSRAETSALGCRGAAVISANPRYHAEQEDDDVAKGKNTRKETKKPKKDKK
jgi:hypothetical protein